ncbi:PbsX family transcriptional regulator [Pseudomonas zeae]|uniref:AbrB/MazE/SpoVT family DNA-binding domain-containing protein n=1 Tax=Pseudomonas zeae TaxID=2745510 RepID=UPI0039E0FB09
MHVTIKKWGNAPSVQIPAAMMALANLSLNSIVDVRVQNGCVVLVPVSPPVIDLEAFIATMTSRLRHPEVNFAAAAGKEAF